MWDGKCGMWDVGCRMWDVGIEDCASLARSRQGTLVIEIKRWLFTLNRCQVLLP